MNPLEKITINRRRFFGISFISSLVFFLKGDAVTKQSSITPPDLNAEADNFLVITDTHIGEKNRDKLAVEEAATTLADIMYQLRDLPVAALINLGDMIEESSINESINTRYLELFISLIDLFNGDKINLLGNHDLSGLKRAVIAAHFSENNLDPSFRQVKTYKHGQIVSLDLKITNSGRALVPEATLEWLKTVIYKDTPTVLLSHYPVSVPEIRNNFHFSLTPEKAVLGNNHELLSVIEGLPVRAIVSGHVHQFSVTNKTRPPQIIFPSMSESLAQGNNMFNPGRFNILEILPDTITALSFSQGYLVNSGVI